MITNKKQLEFGYAGLALLRNRLIGDKRNTQEMLLPSFTKNFGNIPYAEAAVGIENIFKLVRVDLVWRLTHLDPGVSPLGIRARMTFNF